MNKNIFNFKDRTAVITGGAQGFGLDIAKRFLESGARVIIWDIDPKMIEKAEKHLNNSNLMFLQSYSWIIGAFISFIVYYLLVKD